MSFILVIIYFTVFIWLLVPIKQYNTRFFIYFLILGLLDPVAILLFYIFNIDTHVIYLIGTTVLFLPAMIGIKKKPKVYIFIPIIFYTLLELLFSIQSLLIPQLVIHIFILINFTRLMILSLQESKSIKIFWLVILTYEFSVILKFFVPLGNIELGPSYFYFTTAIQIFIGIYFLFYNETNSTKINI